MIRHACALTLLLATPVAARAADARIRTLFYDPGLVVPIAGRVGIQSTIAFAPDEHIENVAVGDSAGWQVTPNRRADRLFVKPMNPRARTNMTVVTDRRTYLFDLRTAPARSAALYALSFTYPTPLAPPIVDAAPPVMQLAVATPAPPRPTALNFAWEGTGAKRLLPARMFDDGTSLYLAWPKEAGLPAMLQVGPDGNEGPVNYSMQGDYVVIDGVPAQLVLRAGKAVATLTGHRAGPAPTATAAR